MELEEFTRTSAATADGDGVRLANNGLLDVPVDGTVMVRAGSMVAYTGEMSFTGKASAEGTPVMEAEGHGRLYVADRSKKVRVLDLDAGESISVSGNDVLAFESTVDYDINTIGSVSEAVAGGLTNGYLTGPGQVAISTHGDPLVLTPPVITDPDATVAWSGDLSPSMSVNKAIEIGRTSDETVQMEFAGSEGFVVVQPHEE